MDRLLCALGKDVFFGFLFSVGRVETHGPSGNDISERSLNSNCPVCLVKGFPVIER